MRRAVSVLACSLLCALALAATPVSSTLAAGAHALSLGVGFWHSCVARSDGTVWCWGDDSHGQIGDGTTGDPAYHLRTTPTHVQWQSGAPLGGVAEVTAGSSSTCALRKDRTVVCWGDDSYAELGDGTFGNSDHVRLNPVGVKVGSGYLDQVRNVSMGGDHACAARTDGSAWCWGDDTYGQLGDGTTGDTTHHRIHPVRVRRGTGFLTDVVQVAASIRYSCALTQSGVVWCWGDDALAQAGDGTTGDPTTHLRLTPTRVLHANAPLSDITQIAATGFHTCARATDGADWCWGDDAFGQLGDGTTGRHRDHLRAEAVRVQTKIGPLANVASVGTGDYHSCARRADGTAWCWGFDVNGQVGDGTTGDPSNFKRLVAHKVLRQSGPLAGVRFVTGGAGQSCALGSTGSVWCWGRNFFGELGRGTHDNNPHAFAAKVLFP